MMDAKQKLVVKLVAALEVHNALAVRARPMLYAVRVSVNDGHLEVVRATGTSPTSQVSVTYPMPATPDWTPIKIAPVAKAIIALILRVG